MTAGANETGLRIPDRPRIGGVLRAALGDFYFNSWRLVPANALWGAGLLIVVLVALAAPLLGLALAVLLAVPTAGIFRLAALIVREQPVSFRDALVAWGRFARPALVAGALMVVGSAVLGFNLVLGLGALDPLLWGFGTLAGWGLLIGWMIALPFWALLVDPLREGEPLRRTLQLAAAVVAVAPLRFVILFGLMTVLLIASTIMFAALLTISIAFIALVVARYTMPTADRLEGRRTQPMTE